MKKLILSAYFMISVTLLSASDFINKNEDFILAGVQQLPEEQMQSITGEDISYYYYHSDTGETELIQVAVTDYAHGYIIIDADTYQLVEENIWYGLE